MCGICGTAGFVDPEFLHAMTDSLTHRGPDSRGVYWREACPVALGNRRLSIMDPTPLGDMPMSDEEGRAVLTYNGEIYNFRDLRSELESLGHRFRSGTDTEVVLRGWLQWEHALFERLNGMFALAILDLRTARDPAVVLARDRFGIKPLYYAQRGRRLWFASEIRALLLDSTLPRAPRPEAIHEYLAFLSTGGPETAFEGIAQVPPGATLTWADGQSSIDHYHRYSLEPDAAVTKADAVERVREALAGAVDRHLVADVPVGVFLSGGLDSSLVAALAARRTGAGLRAFTIGLRPEDRHLEQAGAADAHHARIVARAIDADHHEIVLEPDIASLLPFAVRHLEEPLADPAAISTYLICAAARDDVKVLLSGHGADELFAGYRVHRNFKIARALRWVPGPLVRGPARALARVLPRLRHAVPGISPGLIMAAHRYSTRLIEGLHLPLEDLYIHDRRYLTDHRLRGLYSDRMLERLSEADAAATHRRLFRESSAADFLNRVLYVDAGTFLVGHNLLYSDKMSAAASLELRVPFLDNDVAELAARLPVDLKLRGLRGKYVLREAARGIVPPEVIRRRKAGFGVPVRSWLKDELGPMTDDLLSTDAVEARGWFQPAAVRRLVEEHREGAADHTYQIWALLCLELWQREFMDPASTPSRGGEASPPLPRP